MIKKILVVKEGGGFSFQTQSLLEKLDKEFDVFYLVPQDKHTNRAVEAKDEFEIPKITSIYDRNILRSSISFVKCIIETIKVLRKVKYDAIICIGSSVAIPVFIAGKIFNVKRVFIESITRINRISRTADLLLKLKLCNRIYVQWESLASINKNLVFRGNVL